MAQDPQTLESQLRDLEQKAGLYHREATAGAQELEQTAETLKVCDAARTQLSAALDRQSIDLKRWRDQARSAQSHVEDLEMELHRRQDALAELQRRFEQACALLAAQGTAQALLDQAQREREIAEAVRREGVEALEQARDLNRKD